MTDVPDAVVEAVLIDALREWFGGDRYARDYEYIDANYADKMRHMLRVVLPRAHLVQEGLAVPIVRAELAGDAMAAEVGYTRGFAEKMLAVSAWQDIETAPKDGTRILAHGPSGRHRIIYWGYASLMSQGQKVYGWIEEPGTGLRHPTHWQPLPAQAEGAT